MTDESLSSQCSEKKESNGTNSSQIKITTTAPFGQGVIFAPGDVRPGHMIFAPLSTNLMAPLSTCCQGKIYGSVKYGNDVNLRHY